MKRQIFKSPKEEKKAFKKLLFFSQKSESEIFFDLGQSLISESRIMRYKYTPTQAQFYIGVTQRLGYTRIGKKFWVAPRKKLYKLFCDRGSKAPKTWVKELMGSELRNVWIALLGKVTKTCDVSIAVAIPIVALLLKKGISAFCNHPPR